MLNHLNRLLIATGLTLFCFGIKAQNFSVSAQPTVCYDASQPLRLSDIVSIQGNDADIIQGLQISIVSLFDRTDSFSFVGSGPISGNYDENVGILELSGNASIAQYKTALTQSYFHTLTPERSKSINVTISGVDFLYETGHFYQFFSAAGISWSDAKAEAESKTLYGLQGYLTTITSASENSFILARVSGTAWIGASDAETENTWKWVTGPEAGQAFWQGLAGGSSVNSMFSNWNSGEPNQSGEEDYAHMMDWTDPPGRWNDLPDAGGGGDYTPTGYIVEYGGMPGEPNVLDDLSKTIILDPEVSFDLSGAISVCPNIQGVTYSVENVSGYTYDWSVSGGTIVSGQGTSDIIVDWQNTNPAASVTVDITSPIVCTYSLNLNVKINEQLEPLIPDGPNEICFLDISTPQTYSTPNTNGSDYNWSVTNGTITEGQGTSEIKVLWNGPGMGQVFFTESTSTATDVCDGDSPILSVEIKQEIIPVLSTQNVSCFAGSDGEAIIESVNGSSSFSVVWNTLGSGVPNGNTITDLPAGTYSAEITYQGCTINLPFTITEPPELVGSIEATDATCFGAANGTAQVTVSGGTGAYRYSWSHNGNSSSDFAGNIPEGNHSVEILDDNDCSLILNFTINEPPLLKIDSISTRKASCPQLADGELEAFVSGGTPPYNYSWSMNASTDALASGFPKGDYQVVVTDANGCTASGSQIVEEATPLIKLPNAFSPNADNTNDTFRPANSCPVEYQLTVYGRWGNVIFNTTDIAVGWDGTYEGSPAPQGKYSYFARWVIDANGTVTTEEVRGEFKLIR